MNRIHIDFAPRSMRRTLALCPTRIWILYGLGLLLWIYIGTQAFTLNRERLAGDIEIARLDAEIAKRAARQTPPKAWAIPAGQLAAVNRAIAQLNLPWRDVLDAIERATPPTIAVLTLEPDAHKQSVRGLAEAKTSDAMLAYIEQMKQESFFTEVILIRHEVIEQDPNKPVRFSFEAQWSGAPR